jgi:hypothetical protein
MRNVESRRAASPITFDGSLIHKMNDEREQGLIRYGMPLALAVAGKYQAGVITQHRSSRNARRKSVPPREALFDASVSNARATARFRHWDHAAYPLVDSTALVVDGNLFSDR